MISVIICPKAAQFLLEGCDACLEASNMCSKAVHSMLSGAFHLLDSATCGSGTISGVDSWQLQDVGQRTSETPVR